MTRGESPWRGTDLDGILGAFLLPATLLFGAPEALGSYEKGLFCDSIKLVEFVVELADHGNDPKKAVTDLNKSLDRKACYFSTREEFRARVVKFERNIGANQKFYAIYRVELTAFAPVKTEVGHLAWPLTQPRIMYTLREAQPDHLYGH